MNPMALDYSFCQAGMGRREACTATQASIMLMTMTQEAFSEFAETRKAFKELVGAMNEAMPWLGGIQDEVRIESGHTDYKIETPVVYNQVLDDIQPDSDIQFILIADNPGKYEQLESRRKYLVGLSGKLAEKWFERELGIDFRTQVIILNKTPIHTARTAELKKLLQLAGNRQEELTKWFLLSQQLMAELAIRLHRASKWPIWISGYGELRKSGLFESYARALRKMVGEEQTDILLFRHFSMNQFSREIRMNAQPRPEGENPAAWMMGELRRIGTENRKRILGEWCN